MQDLIATREELGRGRAAASEEFRRSFAIAGSSACDKAFISLDPQEARVAASAQAARLPLAGLPVSVKDLFDVRGQVTAAGSTVLADAAPAAADSAAVARLRAAGPASWAAPT